MRFLAAIVTLAFVASAAAQESLPPTQQRMRVIDSLESRMTRDQQIAYFLDMAGEDRPAADRDRAMKRLYFLYREAGDRTRSDDWQTRRRRFILEQEAIILAAPPLPPPPPLCDPTSTPPTCVNGPIPRDHDVYWRYGILAEAAELRGDFARAIAMSEAAIPFMHGTAPDASHWLSLARKAREFRRFDTALRLCAVASDAPLYRRFRERGERCAADTRYAMEDWAGWLAFYEPGFTSANPRDPGALVRFCIAATRSNRRNIARPACDWAEQSVAARDAEEIADAAERAAGAQRRASQASDESARRRILAGAEINIRLWRQDKDLFDTAIAGCRAALATPDASGAAACGGAPDGARWASSIRLEAIADALRERSVGRERPN